MAEAACIARARAESDAGRFWRAKQILQGSMRNQGYSLEVYRAYGELLLGVGDLVEAGKYLFLSGARNDEFVPAIDLYLHRYKIHWRVLVATFPRAAKLERRLGYPPSELARVL
jgi:hypothetical protein